MSRALLIALTVYLIGYVICLIVTIPLVIWAVHEDEREERGDIEPDAPDLFGRAFLVSMIFSLIWFLFLPLYVLMLAEKITGRGGDD